MKKIAKNKGFTLIEILVVIAIIAILAAIVLVAINPAKRFRDARNSQRTANVESILNAIQQNMVDNKGITTCTIPSSAAGYIKSSATDLDTDLSTCLTQYLAIMPIDPSDPSAVAWTAGTPPTYNSRYQVQINANGQVTVSAPYSTSDGVTSVISVTR